LLNSHPDQIEDHKSPPDKTLINNRNGHLQINASGRFAVVAGPGVIWIDMNLVRDTFGSYLVAVAVIW